MSVRRVGRWRPGWRRPVKFFRIQEANCTHVCPKYRFSTSSHRERIRGHIRRRLAQNTGSVGPARDRARERCSARPRHAKSRPDRSRGGRWPCQAACSRTRGRTPAWPASMLLAGKLQRLDASTAHTRAEPDAAAAPAPHPRKASSQRQRCRRRRRDDVTRHLRRGAGRVDTCATRQAGRWRSEWRCRVNVQSGERTIRQ